MWSYNEHYTETNQHWYFILEKVLCRTLVLRLPYKKKFFFCLSIKSIPSNSHSRYAYNRWNLRKYTFYYVSTHCIIYFCVTSSFLYIFKNRAWTMCTIWRTYKIYMIVCFLFFSCFTFAKHQQNHLNCFKSIIHRHLEVPIKKAKEKKYWKFNKKKYDKEKSPNK